MNSKWHRDLRQVLSRYLKDDASINLVMSMYSALRVTARVMADYNDQDTRQGVGQMLVDLTYGLDTNPVMMNYRQQIWPVWMIAVQGLFDGITYLDEADRTEVQITQLDLRTKAIAANNLIREVAVMVLMCEQGAPGVLKYAAEMRKDLSDVKDPDLRDPGKLD